MSLASAIIVMGLLMLPMRITVCLPQGTLFSMSAYPSPSAHSVSPSTLTATATPGTPSSSFFLASRSREYVIASWNSCCFDASADLRAGSGRTTGAARVLVDSAQRACSLFRVHNRWAPIPTVRLPRPRAIALAFRNLRSWPFLACSKRWKTALGPRTRVTKARREQLTTCAI
uniref:Putative secreted protein n=1 Tax=Ixodes ricinus TaxID=34613 RepID=A0A6B0UZ51_IXORI